MLFTEGRFFLLFAVAFAVYWALRADRVRKLWLILCSAVFYGAWDWRFLGLMLVSIVVDYAVGRGIEAARGEGARKTWLTLSIVANLSLLGFFKYYGFFVDSAVALLAWLGFEASPRTLEVILPVGISFYTFQSMSYTIDVYRRLLPAVRSFTDFALFVAFFPQLVAGPIVRAVEFLPQLERPRAWSDVRVRASLALFLCGYVKKACLADGIAPAIDPVFAAPAAWDTASQWFAVALYHVQIYCDFSGYSDMAIATAGLLGYRLTLNFDFPHLASSFREWWRRWHLSLSSWFRDYLYLPLGGNRRGTFRTYLNLYLVYVLCGLWHGAHWKFVVFFLMHGTFMVVNRLWDQYGYGRDAVGPVRALLGWSLTTVALLFTWPVFRGASWESTWWQYRALVGLEEGGQRGLSPWWLALLAASLAVHVAARRRVGATLVDRLPDWAWAVGFGALAALAAAFSASGYQPFVYFQF